MTFSYKSINHKITPGFKWSIVSGEKWPGPKPPYSKISSVARILASKGYLKYKVYGKTYEYYPAVSQLTYRKFKLKRILSGHFDDSPAELVSFLIKEEKLNKEEIQKLKDIINKIS